MRVLCVPFPAKVLSFNFQANFTVITKMNGLKFATEEEKLKYMNGRWDSLKKGIANIFSSNPLVYSNESLFYHVYIITLHKYGDMLYNNLIETVTDHLKTSVRPIIETATNDNFINELIKCYDAYTVAIDKLSCATLYIDRVYVPPLKLESVKEFGLRLFREEIVDCAPIKEKLKATVVDLRQKDADGTIFKQVYKMLTALGVEKEFEAAMIVYVE